MGAMRRLLSDATHLLDCPEFHLPYIQHLQHLIHNNLLLLLQMMHKSQLVCSGCQNLLLYPTRATSVCCVVCNVVTAGMEQSIWFMYTRVFPSISIHVVVGCARI